MSFTLYASFRDVLLAEKAAGALLDHGVQSGDISLVANDAEGNARVTPGAAVPVDTPAAINTGGDMAIYPSNDPDTANLSEARAAAINQAVVNQAAINQAAANQAAVNQAAANQAAVNQAAANQAAVNQAAVNQAALNRAIADKVVVDRASTVPAAVPVSTGPVTLVPDPMPRSSINPDSVRVDPLVGTPVVAPGVVPVVPVEPVVSDSAPANPEFAAKGGVTTTTAADAEVGAVKGAGIGLGLGILAGLAVLVVPGFGLVVGGGALAMAIGAMAATTAAGAIAGGVTGYLIDQGVPEEKARVYQSAVEHGGAMLAVRVPSGTVNSAEVEHLLTKYSAYDVQVF